MAIPVGIRQRSPGGKVTSFSNEAKRSIPAECAVIYRGSVPRNRFTSTFIMSQIQGLPGKLLFLNRPQQGEAEGMGIEHFVDDLGD